MTEEGGQGVVSSKEEPRYEQLRKLGRELHIPIPVAFWELEVTDREGRVIQRHRQRSHSWVRNAYNLLLSQMAGKNIDDATFGTGKLSIKATHGGVLNNAFGVNISASTAFETSTSGYRCPAANNTYGIQVGSGTDAESLENYKLQSLIAEGVGAGKLNYIASEAPTKTWSAPTFIISWVRYLNNNSGGDVSVNEVGLTARGNAENTINIFLMSRDKLASTITVPDTGQLKVTYIIELTYPA